MVNNKRQVNKQETEMVEDESSGYGMTTLVRKEVMQTKAGSYAIYVPPRWNGEPTFVIFQDEDYPLLAIPEDGRIPIKVSDYQTYTKNPSGKVLGKKVWAIPVSEVLNTKKMVEKALPLLLDEGVKEKLKEIEKEKKEKGEEK